MIGSTVCKKIFFFVSFLSHACSLFWNRPVHSFELVSADLASFMSLRGVRQGGCHFIRQVVPSMHLPERFVEYFSVFFWFFLSPVHRKNPYCFSVFGSRNQIRSSGFGRCVAAAILGRCIRSQGWGSLQPLDHRRFWSSSWCFLTSRKIF